MLHGASRSRSAVSVSLVTDCFLSFSHRVNQFEWASDGFSPQFPCFTDPLISIYSNYEGNRSIHITTTGPEIYSQTKHLPGGLTGFICSTGTGGTLAGVTRSLKDLSQGKIQCWLADPPGSCLEGFINRGTLERTGGSITEGPSYFPFLPIQT